MPRKYFEFTDERRGPGKDRDTGNYPILHEDYPRCILQIVDLSIHPAIEPGNYLYSITYDQTNSIGDHYHYQVAITEVSENKIVSEEELKELTEYCWDWWLSYFLY